MVRPVVGRAAYRAGLLAAKVLPVLGSTLYGYGVGGSNHTAPADVVSGAGAVLGSAMKGSVSNAAGMLVGRAVRAVSGGRAQPVALLPARRVSRGYRRFEYIPRMGRPMPAPRRYYSHFRAKKGYRKLLNRLIRKNRRFRR